MIKPVKIHWQLDPVVLRVQSLWIKDWIYSDRCYIDQVIFYVKKVNRNSLENPIWIFAKKIINVHFWHLSSVWYSVWYNWNLNAAQLIWPLFLIADIVLSSTHWNISAGRQCSKLFTTSRVRMWTEPIQSIQTLVSTRLFHKSTRKQWILFLLQDQ